MNHRIASIPYRFALLRYGFLALGILFAALSPAAADDAKLGDLMLDSPWARATPGAAKNGAAFMVIHNQGTTADRLVSAASDVSARVELHTHINNDGVMQMREVDGIDVPAGGRAELKPGSFHVMMMGLKAPLKEGESFPLTLTFENAGSTTVEVKIESVGAMGSMSSGEMKMDHGHMDHGHTDHGTMKDGESHTKN